MGMGYAPASADVIEDEKLAQLFPKEHKALQTALKKGESTLEALAKDIKMEGHAAMPASDLPLADAIDQALGDLCDSFAAKYPGLTLSLEYHDCNNDGDRHDEVNGAYWDIGGVYVLSKGAKKLGAKNFERKGFVVFG